MADLPVGWSRTSAHCISHIGGRWRVEIIERPDGGMNFQLYDRLEMEIVAVRQSLEKAVEMVSNCLGAR